LKKLFSSVTLGGFPFVASVSAKIVWRVPSSLQPNIKRYAFALGLDANGKVVQNLQDPSPQCFAQLANVVEAQRYVVFRRHR